jgi:hypothetical protein
METTTVALSRQEFETVLYALRLWRESKNSKKKKSMINWYKVNEEFEILDGEDIDKLIGRFNTSCVLPACVVCGWDATMGSKYCPSCEAGKIIESPRCKDCGERLPLNTEEIFCGDSCEESYDSFCTEPL